jgi:hypothetical protein
MQIQFSGHTAPVMITNYEFTAEEIERAFNLAGGRCECCGKQLSWARSRGNPGRGQWEAIMAAAHLRLSSALVNPKTAT